MRKPWSILNIQIFVLLVATVGSLSGCLKPRDSASTGVPSSTWFAGAAAAQNLGGSPSAIKVTWTRADRSTVGYNIYSLRPNGTTGSSEWTLVGSVDGDQTSYTDSENLYEGQIYTYKVQAVDALTGAEDGNSKQVSTVTFFGINDVAITGKTTAVAYLNGNTGAFDEIHIYAVPKNGGGTPTMVAKASGVVSSVPLTGLRSGVNYKFYARAYMSYLGAEDGNEYYNLAQTYSDSFGSGKTSDTTFYYRGVLNVQGFGYAPNATSGPKGKQINLTWLPFSNSTSATKYRVVRSTNTTIDMTATSSCTINSTSSCRVCEVTGSQYCEDTSLASPPQTYYYAISVIKVDKNGVEYVEELPCQNSRDCSNMAQYTIKTHVPPDYMVLVQRDAANYEMCLNINASSDPRHNQRCVYYGLGAVPTTTGPTKPVKTYDVGYYDFGYNLFVDRYKVACNWTKSSSKCGPDGCIGILNTSNITMPPGTVDIAGNTTEGNEGDVFYGFHGTGSWYSQPSCYYKTTSGWVGVGRDGSGLTATQTAAAITNDPGPVGNKNRPPLMFVSPDGAALACGSQSTDYGNKRLLRHREYLVASPLPYISGEPNYISSALSFDAPSNTLCNPGGTPATSLASWLSNTSLVQMYYNSTTYLNSYGTDTVPSLSAKYLIGSPATSSCLSRFGIQDPIGYGMIFSDMFIRSNGTTVPPTATAVSSDYDSGNSDNGNFSFNGTLGSGFSSTVTHNVWGVYYIYFQNNSTTMSCSSNTKFPSSFIPTLGLPVCTWSGSAQSLRTMSEFQATSKLTSLTGGGTGLESNRYPSLAINTTASITGYNMISGFVGRFSTGLTPTSSYIQTYNNIICGVEAE